MAESEIDIEAAPSPSTGLEAALGRVDIHSTAGDSFAQDLDEVGEIVFSNAVVSSDRDFNACFPFGFLWTPHSDPFGTVSEVLRAPLRCKACKAVANISCKVLDSSGKWVCGLCGTKNPSCEQFMSGERQGIAPELSHKTVQYVDLGEQGIVSAEPLPPTVILLIDENLFAKDIKDLPETILSSISKLDERSRVGLISFGKAVNLFETANESAPCVAHSLSGERSPSMEELAQVVSWRDVCLASKTSQITSLQRACRALIPTYTQSDEHAPRCLGAALEVALTLASGISKATQSRKCSSANVVALLGGPLSRGPGVDESTANRTSYMSSIAALARRVGASIHVLTMGSRAIRANEIMRATLGSGGTMRAVSTGHPEELAMALSHAMEPPCITDAELVVRTSAGAAITRVLGCGEQNRVGEGSRAWEVHAGCSFSWSALSGIIAVERDTERVVVQCEARFTDPRDGRRVTRVSSRSFPVVKETATAIAGAVPPIAAMLAIREAIDTAMRVPDNTAVESIVESMRTALKSVAVAHPGGPAKVWNGRRCWPLPQSLSTVPRYIYTASRSAAFRPDSFATDEVVRSRHTFLQCSLAVVAKMMAHDVQICNGTTTMTVPAESTVLDPSCSIVLDTGTKICVWHGHESPAEAQAAALAIGDSLWRSRRPSATFIQCAQFASTERHVTAALIPAHRDTEDEQALSMPHLGRMSAERRQRIYEYLLPTDEPSLRMWARAGGVDYHGG